VNLELEQGRVIGCLIEKQLTTPQQYPLTLNALVSACNQSSNREPVVFYEEGRVQRALASLKETGLVHFVYPSHGRSATRYRHALDEYLRLDERALSLTAILLLRGPQTPGELRIRTERMVTFEGIVEVEKELEAMTARAEPLVLRLPRRPGQKEERWQQLLTAGASAALDTFSAKGDERNAGLLTNLEASEGTRAELVGATERSRRAAEDLFDIRDVEQVRALAEDVAELRSEMAELRTAVEELQAKLR
jgi:uncharacterized protein YceH (UPF0502 family)